MIKRFKGTYIATQSAIDGFPKLGQALSFIRDVTQQHTNEIKSLIKSDVSTETKKPALKDLDIKQLDKAIAQQFKLDIEHLKGSQQCPPMGIYSALGPFDQIFRICRDLRVAQATRQDRLLKAVRTQVAKAKANSKDISNIPGLSIIKGTYL